MKDVILVGIQGSGKGTQAKILRKKGFQILETGSFFRSLRDNDSDLAKRVVATIDKGEYVDDQTVMEIVEGLLAGMNPVRPILYDGIPRSEPQRLALEQLLKKKDREFQVISIKISQEEAFDRLKKRTRTEGRKDDTIEGIKNRIQLFHELTEPMIQAWKKEGRVVEIDGNGTVEEISQRIDNAMQGPKCKKCS